MATPQRSHVAPSRFTGEAAAKAGRKLAARASAAKFAGTLTNNGGQEICNARLEIHVNRGSSTIELGPTVDANWAPGQTHNVVLGFDAVSTDTYSLNPEVTACSGQAASGGEAQREARARALAPARARKVPATRTELAEAVAALPRE